MKTRSILAAAAMTAALFTGVQPADALVDPAFGDAGRVQVTNGGRAAVTPAGKIRTAWMESATQIKVNELNPDGNPNTVWGAGGVVTVAVPAGPAVSALAVAAGPSAVEVLADGSMFAQFEQGGKALIMKLTPTGVLDTTWGGDGFATTSGGCGVPVDGASIPTGIGGGGYYSVAYSSDFTGTCAGSLVRKFDANGNQVAGWGSPLPGNDGLRISTVYAAAGAVDPTDGMYVIVGGSDDSRMAAARVNPAGALDGGFGTGGVLKVNPVSTVPYEDYGTAIGAGIQFSHGYQSKLAVDVAIDSTGKAVMIGASAVVANGTSDIAAVRFTKTGVVDTGFGTSGVALVDVSGGGNDWPFAVAIDATDRPVVAGTTGTKPAQQNQFITRLTTAGALDASFGTNGVMTTVFGVDSHLAEEISLGTNAIYVSGRRFSATTFGGFVAKEKVAIGGGAAAPWPATGCFYPNAPYPAAGFSDVPSNEFYAQPVAWAKAANITTGTTATTYSPTKPVTRSEMAAFLHRMVCNQTGSPASGFSDVPAGQFYTAGVDWLFAKGVTTGTSATAYSPSDTVNRAQMAAFLHRMAGSPTGSPAAGFTDVPTGQFYTESVNWLKAQGITTGTSATTYSPTQPVSRAEMATFLFRMAN